MAAGLLIVASKYSIAHEFALEHEINFSQWTYIDRAAKMRGLRKHRVAFLKGWTRLPEAAEIAEMSRVLELIEVEG